MLIGLNADNPQLHDVYRLDLETGTLEVDIENPGFASWLIDTDLAARGGFRMQADGRHGAHASSRVTGEDWEPLLEIPADDAGTTGLIGFNRDGDAALLCSARSGPTPPGWCASTGATGEQTVVAEDPQYDVAGVCRTRETREPQAVVFDEGPRRGSCCWTRRSGRRPRAPAAHSATASSGSAGRSDPTGGGWCPSRRRTGRSGTTRTTATPARRRSCSHHARRSTTTSSRRWSRSRSPRGTGWRCTAT